MKIGIDCRLWNETGVGRYVGNLVNELQMIDGRDEYTLFVLSKDYEEVKSLASRRSGQKSKVKNNKWKIVVVDIRWHTIEEQLIFPQIINKENLDLMHFPYISVPIFYNKPFVISIHDLIPYHFPTGEASTLSLPLYKLKLLGYKFVLSTAATNAKKIITVSNTTKKEIVDHLKVTEDKVRVTYEGVYDKIRNSNIEIRNKLQNTKYEMLDTKYFLYVGNAFPHKNLDRFLKAFNMLTSQFSDISLILVGKEDYFYKKLKEKTKNLGLDKSVIFAGEISDEELGSLYKNAKALIMPSLMEGFGLPVLEAMANKCLVLTSDIPALQEVCGDAAIYFDPYNIKDMVVKMNEVYSNDTYHYSDKKEKGLGRSKMFSWEKMAKETLKIYESCFGL